MSVVGKFILFPPTRQEALSLYLAANKITWAQVGNALGGRTRATVHERLDQELIRPEEHKILCEMGIPAYLLPYPGEPKVGRPRSQPEKDLADTMLQLKRLLSRLSTQVKKVQLHD